MSNGEREDNQVEAINSEVKTPEELYGAYFWENAFAGWGKVEKQMSNFLAISDIGIEASVVIDYMKQAEQLSEKCFAILGRKLPYHGIGHAKNTLAVGMKILISELSTMEDVSVSEKEQFLKTGALVLSMHEIDDWWIDDKNRNSTYAILVKREIKKCLSGQNIDEQDFDDLIQLDDYMEGVEGSIVKLLSWEGKGFLSEKNPERRRPGKLLLNNLDLVRVLGKSVLAADFMQSLNQNYQRMVNVEVDGQVIEKMWGSVTLAVEMKKERPGALRGAGWARENGEIDWAKVGMDKWFFGKTVDNILPGLEALKRFDRNEWAGVIKNLINLKKYVGYVEEKLPDKLREMMSEVGLDEGN